MALTVRQCPETGKFDDPPLSPGADFVVLGVPVTFGEFLYKLFSDSGEPSSSRILTYIITAFDLAVLQEIIHHMLNMKDNVALAQWLGALPFIIAALGGFAAAPYAINRGSGSLSDVFGAIFKRQ